MHRRRQRRGLSGSKFSRGVPGWTVLPNVVSRLGPSGLRRAGNTRIYRDTPPQFSVSGWRGGRCADERKPFVPGRRIVISGSSQSHTVGVTGKKSSSSRFFSVAKRRSNHDGRDVHIRIRERDEAPQKLRSSVGVKVSGEMEGSGDLVKTPKWIRYNQRWMARQLADG